MGETGEDTNLCQKMWGAAVEGGLTGEVGTYTLDVILEDACYGFTVLDVFLCYDR